MTQEKSNVKPETQTKRTDSSSEPGMERIAVRVRFAPSPTGALHVGGARTAYFNWLFARQSGGTFVLRVDDTDRARSTEASYDQILTSLRWLGLDWDEGPDVGGPLGPYRQSERQTLYEGELARMVSEDRVYPCFCTPEELASEREAAQQAGQAPHYSGRCRNLSVDQRQERLHRGDSHAYRLRAPHSGEVVVSDLIRGEVTFAASEIDDFIVWKADGTPTYHFASCIDDAKMNITHIIRAEEHLSNTPRHIVLFQALGYGMPVFAHVPMILAPDRSKLSKRHGATSVQEYRDAGILPEALVNYLLLLGFSPGDDREILNREEALAAFNLTRVSKNAAVYDVRKLEWLNGNYIRAASTDALMELVWPSLESNGWVSTDESRQQLAWIRTAIQSVQNRSRSLIELVESLSFYFQAPTSYDSKGARKHFSTPQSADYLTASVAALDRAQPFIVPKLEACYHELAAQLGVKVGVLIHPTRLALTGKTAGPGLYELMSLLGKEVCQERMLRAEKVIQSRRIPTTDGVVEIS